MTSSLVTHLSDRRSVMSAACPNTNTALLSTTTSYMIIMLSHHGGHQSGLTSGWLGPPMLERCLILRAGCSSGSRRQGRVSGRGLRWDPAPKGVSGPGRRTPSVVVTGRLLSTVLCSTDWGLYIVTLACQLPTACRLTGEGH